MAKKRDIAPIQEINVTPDAPTADSGVIGDDTQTYSLSPDYVVQVMDILNLAIYSTQFPERYVVNAAEEIQSIVLVSNTADPSGTSLTVHPAWRARYEADKGALMETFSELAKEQMAAHDAARKATEQAVADAVSDAVETEPEERN